MTFMKTARGRALAALSGLLVTLAAAGLVHAGAAPGPQNPAVVCDSNCSPTGQPFQESVNGWELDVTTGGLDAGDWVTLTFQYRSAAPDRLHAVSFSTYNELPSILALPAAPPLGTGASGICSLGAPLAAHAAVADPYSQTLRIQVQQAYASGSLLGFCGIGLGFPIDPTTGYSVKYTEHGQSVTAAYSVAAQDTTKSQLVHIADPVSGSDVTDAGLGGSNLAVYGVSYQLTASYQPNRGIYWGTGAFDSQTGAINSQLHLSFHQTSSGTNVGCTVDATTWCTDATGKVSGTLTVAGGFDPAYVVINGQGQGARPTAGVDSVLSLTVGAAGASLNPVALPSPIPVGHGGPSLDPDCLPGQYQQGGGENGLGSLVVGGAIQSVFYPSFQAECPQWAGGFHYAGGTDELAIASAIEAHRFAFAGLDRYLTASEYAQNQGALQFPVDVQPLVVTYNLPDNPACQGSVRLSSITLSLIFSGQVKSWDDAKIVNQPGGANPNLAGCAVPILVAHDVGVATYVLKDYLSKRGPQWNAYKQSQLLSAWPGNPTVACTANGSRAMALCVLGRPGTIGYGFYGDISGAGLPIASVDNSAGQFPADSPVAGCTTAAATDPAVPATPNADWSSASLTDWAQGYPICAFNFMVTSSDPCPGYVPGYGLKAWLDAVLSDYSQGQLAARGISPLPSTSSVPGSPASVLQNARSGVKGVNC